MYCEYRNVCDWRHVANVLGVCWGMTVTLLCCITRTSTCDVTSGVYVSEYAEVSAERWRNFLWMWRPEAKIKVGLWFCRIWVDLGLKYSFWWNNSVCACRNSVRNLVKYMKIGYYCWFNSEVRTTFYIFLREYFESLKVCLVSYSSACVKISYRRRPLLIYIT